MTFGNLRKSSEYLRQYSEVIENFLEIRVIWIRKSHAFDLGKVGRYIIVHGAIDGYSRLIAFLEASANNRAETVLRLFLEAVKQGAFQILFFFSVK